MHLSEEPSQTVRFGVFELDLRTAELHKAGRRVQIQEQPFRVLAALLEQPGQVVSRELLYKRIWNGNTFGDFETGLNKAIAKIREALSDSADSPLFVETLPKRGYRFIAPVSASGSSGTEAHQPLIPTGEPISPQASIAVLPFTNMSGDQDNEHFGDGLAEETITALMRIPDLKVIARTSAFAFKGRNEDIRRIAEILGVAHILEGSVRRAGTRLRIHAQLIHARDGGCLWSERYDRELTDVFEIQDEIAQAIAAALQIKLSADRAAVFGRYIPTMPAYEAYLRARHQCGKGNLASMARGKQFFEDAIALDPAFALAHVGLAEYYFFASAAAGLIPAHQAMPLIRALAEKALSADPALPEANAMLGVVAGVYDYNWAEAGRCFQLAMAKRPVSSLVRHWYGAFYLIPLGRLEDAVAELARAARENPLDTVLRYVLAYGFRLAGRYEEASAEIIRLCEMEESLWYADIVRAERIAAEGMLQQALTYAEKAYSVAPWSVHVMAKLAAFLMRTGHASRAEEILGKLKNAPEGAARGLCIFHLTCGEVDRAVDWFRLAVEQRDPLMPYMARMKVWRSSPRGPALARMMNLPEALPARIQSVP